VQPDHSKRFETIIENAPVCIHEIDRDGRLVSMNPAGLSMIDSTLEDVKGTPYLSFVTDNDHDRVAELMKRALEHGESCEFEFTTMVGDRVIYFASGFVPLRDTDGQISALMGITRDTTEIHETQARLSASEKRFRDFAETAADYFWELDADLKLRETSLGLEALAGLSGKSRADLAGRSASEAWWELMGAEPPEELMANLRTRTAFRHVESRLRGADGTPVVVEWSGTPFHDDHGNFSGFRGTGRDVTMERKLADKLSFNTSHDALTGLFNRNEFERRLDDALDSESSDDVGHVLLLLDLHRFNLINDSCGHSAGDMVLRELARLIESHVPRHATLGRVGGDEFAVLLHHCTEKRGITICESLLAAVDEFRAFWGESTMSVAASAGVVPIVGTKTSAADVMVAADAACCSAKRLGRNRLAVIRLDDDEYWQQQTLVRDDMRTATSMSDAFRNDRFRLYAHEIVPLKADPGPGARFEILIRMLDPSGDVIPPARFLPVAERYGLVTRVDSWVLETTIDTIGASRQGWSGIEMCNINLSGASLGDGSFLQHVTTQLRRPSVDPSRICFEITETAAIANLETAMEFVAAVRGLGCRFALDDFGTGLSSFEYLKKLHVDFVKIDGEFVKDILDDQADRAIVRAIADVGASMGKEIIAEWVENEEILAVLSELDIGYTQGYVHGKPVPLTDLL